jgi:hypothetical protein
MGGSAGATAGNGGGNIGTGGAAGGGGAGGAAAGSGGAAGTDGCPAVMFRDVAIEPPWSDDYITTATGWSNLDFACASSSVVPGFLFRFTAPKDGTVAATLIPSDSDFTATVSAHAGTSCATPELGCTLIRDMNAVIEFPVATGHVYYVSFARFSGTGQRFHLDIRYK